MDSGTSRRRHKGREEKPVSPWRLSPVEPVVKSKSRHFHSRQHSNRSPTIDSTELVQGRSDAPVLMPAMEMVCTWIAAFGLNKRSLAREWGPKANSQRELGEQNEPHD
jgi:hypothetical protein